MQFEVNTKHGKILVDDALLIQGSESYDIYEGVRAAIEPGYKMDGVVKLYCVHNEYGAVALVFARCEQDAIDAAADAGKLDSCKIDPADTDYDADADTYLGEEVNHLGNAGEPFDLTNIGVIELPVPKFSLAGLFVAASIETDTSVGYYDTLLNIHGTINALRTNL
jgi:hypothetical protein